MTFGSTVTDYKRRQFQLQERRAAKDVGGRVQPGSGSTAFAKGDVRTVGKLRLECKTTSGSSFILKLKELLKIEREAQDYLEDWAFQIQFQRQSGMGKKYVVCDLKSFMQNWNQAGGGNLQVEELVTASKQINISLPNLIAMHGVAELKDAALLMEVMFLGEGMNSGRQFALTTWETYQGVRDSGA